ncbi:MAG: hypothetical protein GXP53_07010 [Deltaproteobacteria bacterium]|nr:hypothetical protein [Deltaproteobacteria bacterium]
MMINKNAGCKLSPFFYFFIIGTIVCPLMFSGCGLPKKQARIVHYYTLSYDAPKASGIKKAPAVIRIKPPIARPPYDSIKIVYSTGPYQQAFYRYHMWVAFPADMIFNMIERDFRQSGIADAVITGPSGIAPTHSLEIVINKFYEKDGKNSWSAILSLTTRLVKENPAGPSKLIYEKTYEATKELGRKNPAGLARAMSQCLSKISGRMIKDVYTNLN